MGLANGVVLVLTLRGNITIYVGYTLTTSYTVVHLGTVGRGGTQLTHCEITSGHHFQIICRFVKTGVTICVEDNFGRHTLLGIRVGVTFGTRQVAMGRGTTLRRGHTPTTFYTVVGYILGYGNVVYFAISNDTMLRRVVFFRVRFPHFHTGGTGLFHVRWCRAFLNLADGVECSVV